ncbi:dephospho-CoA kinase [soil metagenome]
MANMKVWIVTGGAACGKSHFCQLLKSSCVQSTLFSSDETVHLLLNEDDVKSEIASKLGPNLVLKDGHLDKKALRESIFQDPSQRHKLESILHPRVFAAFAQLRDKLISESESQLLIAEVPLFYETKADLAEDLAIVVATDPSVQLKRLTEKRGLEASIAHSLLQAQMPLQTKMQLADIVIWNDGSEKALMIQAQILLQQIPASHAK